MFPSSYITSFLYYLHLHLPLSLSPYPPPPPISVSVSVFLGTTVTWFWNTSHHSILDEDESRNLYRGREPGEYNYMCFLHETMKGTITVLHLRLLLSPPSPPPRPPPPPPRGPPPPLCSLSLPPPSAICSFQYGWVIWVNDLLDYAPSRTLSVEECCTLCNQVSSCTAFSYFWETKLCALKSSVGTNVTSGQATTGFGGENLAFNKPTALSSTYLDLDGILDVSNYGVNRSTWERWFSTIREPTKNGWWRMDLNSTFLVSKVELYNRIMCFSIIGSQANACGYQMTGVKVWITNSSVSHSTDGSECNPAAVFDYAGGSYGFPFVKECN